MKITFYGGAKSVTGANYLLTNNGVNFLVDCGLFQGKNYEEMNYKNFEYNPQKIKSVFITHAHIDHIGRIPKLVKEGFNGKIYSTNPTKDLSLPMLLDAAKIMRKESRTFPYPLFSEKDVLRSFALWRGVDYHETLKFENVSFEFVNAGHILGSASVLISFNGKKIIFSGDLGNINSPFIQGSEKIKQVNTAVIESTYGNRLHKKTKNRKEILKDYIKETIKNKGVLLIPAFALERTQELIFELNEIVEKDRLRGVNVFLDGVLVNELFKIYKKYSKNEIYFNKKAIALQKKGDDIFNFPGLKVISSEEESQKIHKLPSPKIIIAASGMSVGGRVLLHEARYLENPKNILLMVGYQSKESLGGRILAGEKEIKILGESVKIKAKVAFLDGYSAHADEKELLNWVSSMSKSLEKVFVVQGEEDSSLSLAKKIEDTFKIKSFVPNFGESVLI